MSHFLYRPKIEQIDLMQWHVESWTAGGSIDRIEAICANPNLAIAAFHAAVEAWPNKELTCRHGARVIEQYKPDKKVVGELR